MAEKLTGAERAGSILSEMNRQNQFTKKYLQREPVYEYHDLFREFLLEQAKDAFSWRNLRRSAELPPLSWNRPDTSRTPRCVTARRGIGKNSRG